MLIVLLNHIELFTKMRLLTGKRRCSNFIKIKDLLKSCVMFLAASFLKIKHRRNLKIILTMSA